MTKITALSVHYLGPKSETCELAIGSAHGILSMKVLKSSRGTNVYTGFDHPTWATPTLMNGLKLSENFADHKYVKSVMSRPQYGGHHELDEAGTANPEYGFMMSEFLMTELCVEQWAATAIQEAFTNRDPDNKVRQHIQMLRGEHVGVSSARLPKAGKAPPPTNPDRDAYHQQRMAEDAMYGIF